jgi:hypothetical protein
MRETSGSKAMVQYFQAGDAGDLVGNNPWQQGYSGLIGFTKNIVGTGSMTAMPKLKTGYPGN